MNQKLVKRAPWRLADSLAGARKTMSLEHLVIPETALGIKEQKRKKKEKDGHMSKRHRNQPDRAPNG